MRLMQLLTINLRLRAIRCWLRLMLAARRMLLQSSQKDTPPGLKCAVPAAPCFRLGR